MKDIIKEIIRECKECQIYKNHPTKLGKITGHIYTSIPMKDISTDIYGPINNDDFLDCSSRSKLYFHTITDLCTRWSEVYLLEDLKTNSIIQNFIAWITKNNYPETILSDQGKQFTSSSFKQFLQNNNIKQILATTYNPTCNAISERINPTISLVIKTNKGKTLSEVIDLINFRLQNLNNRSMQFSPNEVRFNKSIFDPLERYLTNNLEISQRNSKKQVEYDNTRINNKRNTNFQYNVGNLVFKKEFNLNNKLSETFSGPYEITRIYNNNNTFELKQNNEIAIANLKQIRLFKEEEDVVVLSS